jgi:hypothetical protein
MRRRSNRAVPIVGSALSTAEIIRDARLKIYRGAPHGLCRTGKERVNADEACADRARRAAPAASALLAEDQEIDADQLAIGLGDKPSREGH